MASFTLVAFHAHPDDEALLTGGTLARLADEGHRVVLVSATDGGRGLAGAMDGAGPVLERARAVELDRAGEILGVARVVHLGYPDSGLRPDPEDRTCFAHLDVEAVAEVLARVLRQEDASALMTYDANGGYGHPDHVQVHRVGRRAAQLAGTSVVLEATVPGGLFSRFLSVLTALGHPLGRGAPLGTVDVYSPGRAITHRVRVIGAARRKRAAMVAHASQARGDSGRRMLDYAAALPLPLFALVFGHEWYVERGRPGPSRLDDVFATLRQASSPATEQVGSR